MTSQEDRERNRLYEIEKNKPAFKARQEMRDQEMEIDAFLGGMSNQSMIETFSTIAIAFSLLGCGVIIRAPFEDDRPCIGENISGIYYQMQDYRDQTPPYGRHGFVGLFGVKTGRKGAADEYQATESRPGTGHADRQQAVAASKETRQRNEAAH